MLTEKERSEYVDEIRREVCAHCPERPPGGPPCAPLGKVCGVELHLPRLIESIRAVHSTLAQPYQTAIRQEVCALCGQRGQDCCPCPMAYLSILLVQAVEDAGERLEQWEWLRRRVCRPPCGPQVSVAKLAQAYEEATGTSTGCD